MPTGKSTGTDRKAGEAQALYVSMHRLACQPSAQREPCTGGCCLPVLPSLKGRTPWSRSLHPTGRHNIWAKAQSSYAETDQGIWCVLRVGRWWPLSVHAQEAWGVIHVGQQWPLSVHTEYTAVCLTARALQVHPLRTTA